MFNRIYELSLNRNYVSHWGLLEAVRELIQNSLDSESPFVYEFSGGTLTLTSEFTTLSASTLLLGSTSKANSDDSIGSFGEGYKIALLVLTRLGHEVQIDNGDKRWTPKFKHHKHFNEELLVIEETSLPYRGKGLSFRISGLSELDEENIRDTCLQMQDHVGEIHPTSYGDILREKPGMLYVGGLFICETDLEFGYNMHPSKIKLERDRQTVSNWDLKSNTKNMWFETNRMDEIVDMIERGVEDLAYAEYGSPQVVKEACYQHFQKQHPGAIAVINQKELQALVEKGMTVVVVGSGMYSQLSNSIHYQKEMKVTLLTPEQTIQKFFSDYRGNMRTSAIVAFKELMKESKGWRRI